LVRRSALKRAVQIKRPLRHLHHQARRAGRLDIVRVAVGYMVRGDAATSCRSAPSPSPSASRSTKSTPAGRKSTFGIKSFDKLPKNAQSYLKRLEQLVDAPIAIISTGPDAKRRSSSTTRSSKNKKMVSGTTF